MPIDSSPSPQVSVILPVYNDPDGILVTLESLLDQQYDQYEILPIDNNSTDETGSVIATIASEQPNLVFPYEETNVQSSYAARNTGIEHASGEVLLFIDADMWIAQTWIEEMVNALHCQNCDYLGCDVEVVVHDKPTFAERYEKSLSFPIETYLRRKHFAPTCALAVRREVFDEVGLFDKRLVSGGDKEFGQRVHRAGFKQCYTDDLTAYHPARNSWQELRSKALRIGRGRTQMRQYHPEVEGYHHPLHPINYLPPSPFRLRRRFSGRDVSLSSLVGYYFLEYLLKLIQTYSTLRKLISLRFSEREVH